MKLKINEVVLARDYCLEDASGIAEADVVSYLATLRRVAALGGISPSERKLHALLVSYLGISPRLVGKAARLASSRAISTQALLSKIKDVGFRICLLRDAYRMALADGKVDDVEASALREIGRAVDLPAGLVNQIKQCVDQELAIQSRFAELVRRASRLRSQVKG